MNFLIVIVMVTLATVFLRTVLDVVGATHKMQIKGSKLISKIANCSFCFTFWLCVFVSITLAFFAVDPIMILTAPIFATIPAKLISQI